ncbi:hypothetical protein FYK55_11310 [Roseiconus nitratireducens]|uniref:Uncharacterized protein n=1 Tax=Roseiconus nitratireducens TaxID=2605748 RepID=A0A5M6DBR6_9BACT|nr:hypothetical protein [Roseiconus nitratireducens]KAA5543762.1 hypothetical protein FYK55_11310 [Roseiconus nitratireducens]
MNVQILAGHPDPALGIALENFESEFRYPLGGAAWFRISHGSDYTRFFRAIGDARCFVATTDERIAGVLSVSLSPLHVPGQGVVLAAYLSDLKIRATGLRPGRVLLSLFRAAEQWVGGRAAVAFSVVMEGTSRLPSDYTGRQNIVPFRRVAELMVMRIAYDQTSVAHRCGTTVTIDSVEAARASMASNQHYLRGGESNLRSQMRPVGLTNAEGSAVAVLEDTRKAKRLFREDGSEMVSAHLTSFGYRNIAAASELIRVACGRCSDAAVPALFVAVPRDQTAEFMDALPPLKITQAPATVFAADLSGTTPLLDAWSIDTAQI